MTKVLNPDRRVCFSAECRLAKLGRGLLVLHLQNGEQSTVFSRMPSGTEKQIK